MTNLQEVPTDDLLSFQDYPTVHSTGVINQTTVSVAPSEIDVQGNIINPTTTNMNTQRTGGSGDAPSPALGNIEENTGAASPQKSFWTIEYYQKFFDVDTQDVVERILASITPKWDNSLKHHLRTKPDLYGPFWISVTLIFTIAISGNVANYLQHASTKYHWKYDFQLVSYAATTIFLYVTIVPSILYGLLRYTTHGSDIEELDETVTPGALELICIYGYSLFIYIPSAILWSIQINLLQWLLALIATFISGSVLLLTLMPALRLSRQRLLLSVGIVGCHLLLAAGFVMCFFHSPDTTPVMPEHLVTTANSVVLSNSSSIAHKV